VRTRPIAGEFATRWRAGIAYALLGVVLMLTVALPITAFWRDARLAVDTLGPFALFEGQVVLATFLLLWFLLQGGVPARPFLHLPRGRWASRMAEGVRVGVVGWLVTMVVMIPLGILAHTRNIVPHEGFAELMAWMARRPIPLRLALITVAMIVEEAFFRAFLQPRFGFAIATVWFALTHINYGSPLMGGGVLVIGWVLGRTFRRTNDLAVCAIAHGTFDAIQLLVILPLAAARL
jgi:membrane protease YdiL (CAAX protease family)